MKKLIYEVFRSKRNGGDSYANVYSDGSYESTATHFPPPDQDIPSDEEVRRILADWLDEQVQYVESQREGGASPFHIYLDWFDNPRYEEAYSTLIAVTGTIYPFRGYRIVYHGEGKPWKRVVDEGTVF